MYMHGHWWKRMAGGRLIHAWSNKTTTYCGQTDKAQAHNGQPRIQKYCKVCQNKARNQPSS